MHRCHASCFNSKYSPRKGTIMAEGFTPLSLVTRSLCKPAQLTICWAANSPAVVSTMARPVAGALAEPVAPNVSRRMAVARALVEAGADLLADSRLENLQALRRMGATLPLMLLRIPAPGQAADVVRWSDVSLNSSVTTLRLLSQAANSVSAK